MEPAALDLKISASLSQPLNFFSPSRYDSVLVTAVQAIFCSRRPPPQSPPNVCCLGHLPAKSAVPYQPLEGLHTTCSLVLRYLPCTKYFQFSQHATHAVGSSACLSTSRVTTPLPIPLPIHHPIISFRQQTVIPLTSLQSRHLPSLITTTASLFTRTEYLCTFALAASICRSHDFVDFPLSA